MLLKTMLAELGIPLKAVPIYGDNQGAILMPLILYRRRE
jgi:hypothetical protein